MQKTHYKDANGTATVIVVPSFIGVLFYSSFSIAPFIFVNRAFLKKISFFDYHMTLQFENVFIQKQRAMGFFKYWIRFVSSQDFRYELYLEALVEDAKFLLFVYGRSVSDVVRQLSRIMTAYPVIFGKLSYRRVSLDLLARIYSIQVDQLPFGENSGKVHHYSKKALKEFI